MDVILGKEGLKCSWQQEFEEEIKCPYCKGMARIAFVVGDDIKDAICNLHDNEWEGEGYWPHDLSCFAVYLCRKCFKGVVDWNQA